MKINTLPLKKRIAHAIKTFVHTMGRILDRRPRTIPANCTNIHALLMHLCDFDQQVYRYVIKWLAYPVQNPGAKMQSALVINGARGAGASIFFERVMCPLYYIQARKIRSESFIGRLNLWASGARFVVIDGEFSDDVADHLKALVSTDKVTINTKGLPEKIEQSQANYVLLTSSPGFLPVSSAHRRFMVIETPPAREALFYKAVAAEIENDGVEAFRRYLRSGVDLADFNQFSRPPINPASQMLESAQCQ